MSGIRRVSQLGTAGESTFVDGSIQTVDIANNAVTQGKLASTLSGTTVTTSSSRSTDIPAPFEGQMAYLTDSDLLQIWNGTSWRTIAISTATNGTVLQVVTGSTTTTVTNSTSTYIDSGLTATITPKSTSSKVLVMTAQVVGKGDQNSENRVSMSLVRNSTQLMTTGTLVNYDTKLQYDIGECSILYLDSPATLSATIYKTQISNPNNTAYAVAQYGNGTSTIILMEIAG